MENKVITSKVHGSITRLCVFCSCYRLYLFAEHDTSGRLSTDFLRLQKRRAFAEAQLFSALRRARFARWLSPPASSFSAGFFDPLESASVAALRLPAVFFGAITLLSCVRGT
mmetsp:Transcript_9453/g.20684  ORF Transcript_9453/g.20684 Transcript_9453/m.20684 type:complete len:112 (-) Transcript_9453:734-1069(-)